MLTQPEIQNILSFALAAVFMVLIPGINMTYLIACATTQGRRVAVFALLGSNAALLFLGLLTGLGLASVFMATPYAYKTLKILGAVYFLYLAMKSIITKPAAGDKTITITGKYSPLKAFRNGFITNVLNPKAIAFYVAVFPQFLILRLHYLPLQGLALAGIHAIISFCINSGIIYSSVKLASTFNGSPRLTFIKKWGTAAIFAFFAVRILV